MCHCIVNFANLVGPFCEIEEVGFDESDVAQGQTFGEGSGMCNVPWHEVNADKLTVRMKCRMKDQT